MSVERDLIAQLRHGMDSADDSVVVVVASIAEIRAIFNAYDAQETALVAAGHALRSYEFGNASTELAKSTADHIEKILKGEGD